eukprot:scaffold4760_cov113-Isochrysis_galbana.AAC.14
MASRRGSVSTLGREGPHTSSSVIGCARSRSSAARGVKGGLGRASVSSSPHKSDGWPATQRTAGAVWAGHPAYSLSRSAHQPSRWPSPV